MRGLARYGARLALNQGIIEHMCIIYEGGTDTLHNIISLETYTTESQISKMARPSGQDFPKHKGGLFGNFGISSLSGFPTFPKFPKFPKWPDLVDRIFQNISADFLEILEFPHFPDFPNFQNGPT